MALCQFGLESFVVAVCVLSSELRCLKRGLQFLIPSSKTKELYAGSDDDRAYKKLHPFAALKRDEWVIW